MSYRSSEHHKRTDNNMPSHPDPRASPPHPAVADRGSRAVRAPSHHTRRHSTLFRSDEKHHRSHQTAMEDEGRRRHWNTVMGSEGNQNDSNKPHSSSSSSPDARMHDRNSRDHSRRDSQQHVSRAGQSDSRRRPSHTVQDVSSSRPARAPPAKPFHCEYCPRRFERRGHLESHVSAVHRLQQPYHCNGCGKAFSHRSSLYRHMKGVHEKHQYPGNSSKKNDRPSPPGSGSGFSFGFMQ